LCGFVALGILEWEHGFGISGWAASIEAWAEFAVSPRKLTTSTKVSIRARSPNSLLNYWNKGSVRYFLWNCEGVQGDEHSEADRC
jgi:hypothetical protein